MTKVGINTGINVFKENLINLIGNSQLPIGITYYVLKDVFVDIERLYNETLVKEQQEILETSLKENKDKKDKDETNEEIENK